MKRFLLIFSLLFTLGCSKDEGEPNDNSELVGTCWTTEWIDGGLFLDYRYSVCFALSQRFSWSTYHKEPGIFNPGEIKNPSSIIGLDLEFEYKKPNLKMRRKGSSEVVCEGSLNGSVLTLTYKGVTYSFTSNTQ